MTDDHGDQFPGALPAPAASHRVAADERIVRMHPDSRVQAGRDDVADHVAEAVAQESGSPRRAAGRRTPTRGEGGRRPEAGSRLGRITRSSLQRFDRYTLDVFNAGSPYRSER